jgi:hypothetical protein
MLVRGLHSLGKQSGIHKLDPPQRRVEVARRGESVDTGEVITQQSACTTRDTLIVGAAAGLTSGLAMAMWAMLTAIWHGLDITAPFQMIGATFMGPSATHATFAMTTYGMLVHGVMSAGLGVLFVALLPPTCSCRYACAAGLGFGLAVLLAMTYVVTPAVNPVMRHAVAAIPKSWIIQHAIFGAMLAVVPVYWRYYREEGDQIGEALRLTVYANKWSLVRQPSGQVVAPHPVAKLPAARRRPLKHVEVFGLKGNGTAAGQRNPLALERAQVDREVPIHVHRVDSNPTRNRAVRHLTPRTIHPGADAVTPVHRTSIRGK